MRLSLLASVLLVSAASFVATEARGDGALELERAKNSYDAGRYEEGVERFRAVLDDQGPEALQSREQRRQARAYYAACLIALGKAGEADEQLELILRDDPAWRPDPVVFPGRLVDRFTGVRMRVQAELEAQASAERRAQEEARLARAAYIRSLELLAKEEVTVERRSRFIAALPFGAGQFQADQPVLGFTLLATQALAIGASVGSFIASQAVQAEAASAPDSLRATYNDDLRTWRMRTNISAAVFAGLALGGILHAQLSFVPEVREVRERPLPKPPAGVPIASPLPGGGLVGWSGVF